MDIRSRLGTHLAGYRIDSVIGRGGMGVVYLAEHLRLHRKVALKVISPELSSDERFRRRFLRESEIAASLDHPHVIPIYDAGEADGDLYLAMRYVEGTDLGKHLREQRPSLDEVRDLVAQLCDALDRAHAHGLVHRDVKPENVLLAAGEGDGGRDHLYLCDFGLGKSATSLHPQTSTDRVVGTVDYLAPEVIAGSAATAASDLYAVGCLTYRCLVGQLPFPRGNDIATLWAHMHDPPPSVHAAAPDLPARLDPVLERALAKAPEDRQRTCGTFARELAAAASPAAETATGGANDRRWLAAGIAAVAGMVVAAGVAAAVLLTRDGSPTAAVAPPPRSTSAPLAAYQAVPINPSTMTPAKGTPFASVPTVIEAGFGALWVALGNDRVIRIEPANGESTSSEHLHGTPTALTMDQDSVWVLEGMDQYFATLNPRTMRQREHVVPLCCRGPGAVAADADHVFVAVGDATTRFGASPLGSGYIRPGTGSAGFAVVPTGPGAGLWQTDGHRSIVRRDANLGVVQELAPVVSDDGRDGRPVAIAADATSLWVAAMALDQVWRFPLGGGTPTVIDGIDRPTGIATGLGSVWVISSASGTLTRIDPQSLQDKAVDLQVHLGGVAVAGGRVWVTTQPPKAAGTSAEQLIYGRHGRIKVPGIKQIRGRWPSWYFDGTQVTFSQNGQIYTADSRGKHVRPLGASGTEPAWGPGGAWIAYVAGSAGARQIWMMKADGGLPVQLTTSNADNRAPAWSPDGSQIAYLSTGAAGQTEIHVLHPTRLGPRDDHPVSYVNASAPVWSPDGRDLAFWSDKDGSGIYLLTLDNGDLSKLVALPGAAPDPSQVRLSWALDGRTIAIAARGRMFEVYADGSGLERYRHLSDVQSVAYQPGQSG